MQLVIFIFSERRCIKSQQRFVSLSLSLSKRTSETEVQARTELNQAQLCNYYEKVNAYKTWIVIIFFTRVD